MTIYDELIEMEEAGMNSTSLVFINMISSSFLIQPIMNKHVCNDCQTAGSGKTLEVQTLGCA